MGKGRVRWRSYGERGVRGRSYGEREGERKELWGEGGLDGGVMGRGRVRWRSDGEREELW